MSLNLVTKHSLHIGTTAWILAGNLSRYAAQFLVLWSLSVRFGADAAGRLAFAIAVTSPVFILFGLGLRNLYFTLGPDLGIASFRRVRFLSSTVALVLSAAGVFLPLGFPALAVLAVAVGKWLDGVMDLGAAVLQDVNRTRRMALAYVAQLLASVVAICVTWAIGVGEGWSLAGPLVVGGGVGAMLIQRWSAVLGRQGAEGGVRPIVAAGVPTGVGYAVVGLLVNVPQYFLFAHFGPGDVARLASILYIGTAIEMLLNAQSQSAIGRLGGLSPANAVTFVINSGLRWALFSVPAGILGSAGYWLLAPRVLGPTFTLDAASALAVVVLSAAFPLVYSAGASITLARLYRWLPLINLFSLVIVSATSLVLVPVLGVAGALMSVAASQMGRGLVGLVVVRLAARRYGG
ncbi:hypothetical protein [Raineyella sp. LH-20]|uniref:hypothetical protein n=1 Tax=Raineyella sp. LH-20 TaxID=3081204 RepID=UPI002954DACA|nr:hypothetical protein [Raineyella sp. LH-20]WOP19685.1 hypothetical protein R0146_05255 [Raineyella sp. LH-20]